MALTINRPAWQKLIDENLEWIRKQERTLERDHIIDILNSIRCVRPRALENFLGDEKRIETEERNEGVCEICRQVKPLMQLQPICADCY